MILFPALILALAPALLPVAVLAVTPERPEGLFFSDARVEYLQIESVAGVVLRSRTPVTYHVGAAAAERSGIETLTFAADCTVESSLLGSGAWGQGQGGVRRGEDGPGGLLLSFAGPAFVGFPGQSLSGLGSVCLHR